MAWRGQGGGRCPSHVKRGILGSVSVRRRVLLLVGFLALVGASVFFGRSVNSGDNSGAVTWGLFMLIGVANVIRGLLVDEQRRDLASMGRRKTVLARLVYVIGGLAAGTLFIVGAVRATIESVHASGGERVTNALVAGFFYLVAALFTVGMIVGARLLPGDAAVPREGEGRSAGPDNLGDSSAESARPRVTR